MKSKLLFLGLLAFGMLSMNGQASLTELLSRLQENHMGAVSDVFSPEEIQTLRAHFDAINETAVFNPENGGKNIFAPENNTTQTFGWFDSNNVGTFNTIGPGGTADFEGAGALNPFTGDFFVIDDAGNAYEVNPVTGVYVFQGTVTPPAGESITGIEFDPITQEFYAISTDGAGISHLSTVDVLTLTLTPIGNTSLVVPIALGFDNAGMAYTYDIDDDILYRLNIGTGAATAVGPIGFDASFGQGMFLCPTSGNLYMTAFNAGTFQSEFRMVNTSTGATTDMGAIGATSPGGTLQFAWSGTEEDPLSVEDVTLFDGLSMYPVPAGDRLNVSAANQIQTVEIYNMLGQRLLVQQGNDTKVTIDVSGLSAGNYLAAITINGAQKTQAFIKR